MRGFRFGFGASRHRTFPFTQTPAPTPTLFPLSTPILFEGDSNTAWRYQTTGWAKQALRLTDGRFYLPVGGDFAVAGSTVQSMVARQAQVVAKIQAMVALKGHCLVWFQIGTNGGSMPGDLASLASLVAAYRAAGAIVCANTCPTFGQPTDPQSYVGQLNTWLAAAGNVDQLVDVNTVVTTGDAGQTHYEPAQNRAVGQAVATALLARISSAGIYADPAVGLVIDDFAGTGGTLGGGTVSGQVPTGWTLGGLNAGSAVASIVAANASLSGQPAVRVTVTGPTVASGDAYAYFTLSKTEPLTVATGDVVDGWTTVSLVSTTDASFHAHMELGGGTFPQDLGGSVEDAGAWGGDTHVWRAYPVNQPGAATTIPLAFGMLVEPGQTATFEIAGFAYVIREHSAVIAPVNTAVPVMAPATVGGSPAVASAGTYSGTTPITLSYVYYLDQTPLPAGYVYAAADVGNTVTAHETATNAGGSTGAVSAGVTVAAAVVTGGPVVTATTLDSSYHPDGQLIYSNDDRTATNTYANFAFVPSAAGRLTGRYYVEAANDANLFGVGVGESAFGDARCAYLLPNGAAYRDGGFAIPVPGYSYGAGDRIGIDCDADARTVRFRVNGGPWSAPFAIGGIGALFARLALNNVIGSRGTMRFAAADWADAAPAGAGVWPRP